MALLKPISKDDFATIFDEEIRLTFSLNLSISINLK